MQFSGRVAVVTGAANGIGRATAGLMADHGAQVAALDLDSGGLARLAGERCGTVSSYDVDVTAPGEVERAVGEIATRLGRIDFLVHAAGGGYFVDRADGDPVPVINRGTAHVDDRTWRRMLAMNLDSLFYVCRAVAPIMQAQEFGRIVCFSSIAARRGGSIANAAYAAAKGGVSSFAKVLAAELGPYGVTCNTIAPGFIATERLLAKRRLAQASGAEAGDRTTRIPLARAGLPEEPAGVAVALCAPAFAFVTGATIDVNGGEYTA